MRYLVIKKACSAIRSDAFTPQDLQASSLIDAHRDGAKRFIYGMGWPDPYFNLDNALPEADLQKAQSLYESVNAQKESRLKWMRGNKGGDAIIDYVRKRIMQDVRNYEARARQRSRR